MLSQQSNIKQLEEISNTLWNQYFKQIGQVKYVQSGSFNIIYLKQYGKRIIIGHYQVVPSTMILSQRWPRQTIGENDIFCFVADQQNKGVGQRDNKWISPKGNLYATVLTIYDLNEVVKLPIKVSNSLTRTISQLIGDSTLINTKWINDIFLAGQKTAGILIRNEINTLSKSRPTVFCEIGVGINVKSSPSSDFTYLEKYCSQISLQKLNLLLLDILTKNLFFVDNFSQQKEYYEKKLLYLLDQVEIYDATLINKLYEGIFKGVNEYGHAIIMNTNGEEKVIFDGRMRGKKNQVLDSLSIKIRLQELL